MTHGIRIYKTNGSLQIDDRMKVYHAGVMGKAGYITTSLVINIKSYDKPLLAVRGGVGKLVAVHHNGSYYDSVSLIGRPDVYAGKNEFEYAILCTGADLEGKWGLQIWDDNGRQVFNSDHPFMKIRKSVDVTDYTDNFNLSNAAYYHSNDRHKPVKWDMWYGNHTYSHWPWDQWVSSYGEAEIPQNLRVREQAHSPTAWAVVDGAFTQMAAGGFYFIARDQPLAGISNGQFIFLTHSYYYKASPTEYNQDIGFHPPPVPALGTNNPGPNRYVRRFQVMGYLLSIDL